MGGLWGSSVRRTERFSLGGAFGCRAGADCLEPEPASFSLGCLWRSCARLEGSVLAHLGSPYSWEPLAVGVSEDGCAVTLVGSPPAVPTWAALGVVVCARPWGASLLPYALSERWRGLGSRSCCSNEQLGTTSYDSGRDLGVGVLVGVPARNPIGVGVSQKRLGSAPSWWAAPAGRYLEGERGLVVVPPGEGHFLRGRGWERRRSAAGVRRRCYSADIEQANEEGRGRPGVARSLCWGWEEEWPKSLLRVVFELVLLVGLNYRDSQSETGRSKRWRAGGERCQVEVVGRGDQSSGARAGLTWGTA